METLKQDLVYGFRAMRKNPGFTFLAILSLALAIGANTSIFSLINGLILRPLPYKEPDRLLMVYRTDNGPIPGTTIQAPWSYPKFQILRDNNAAFEEVAAFTKQGFSLTGTDDPERLEGEIVTASYFPLLGVNAEVGRTFLPEEDMAPDASPVAIISYGLWQRRFGGDTNILGKTIGLNNSPLTIVGVMQRGFRGQSKEADVWVPTMVSSVMPFPGMLEEKFFHWLDVVGRLKPGVTQSQAEADMGIIGRAVEQAVPSPMGPSNEKITIVPLKEDMVDPSIQRSLLLLLAVVGLVLLIACTNLANLLLGRALARRKEISIRLAVGATRGRIVRQLITESVALAGIGGLLGLLLVPATAEFLSSFKPTNNLAFGARNFSMLDFTSASIDGRVLAFNIIISLLAGIFFGLIPALQTSRLDLNLLLKEASAMSNQRFGRMRLFNMRNALVVLEIVLSLVILVGAGLMIKSFARMRAANLGFDPSNTLTMRLDLPKYSPDKATAFYEQLTQRIAGLPGVQAVSVSSSTPLSSNSGKTAMAIEGQPPTPTGPGPSVEFHSVGPDYFKTLHIALVRGRSFTDQDRAGSPRIAIINETAARNFWRDTDPLGKRIRLYVGWEPEDDWAEIVGILSDVKYGNVDEKVEPAIYLSYLQGPIAPSFLYVRAAKDPSGLIAGVRREVLSLDKNVPTFNIKTLEERISDSTSRTRFNALLLAIFAGLAVLLAATGIYGVMSFAVSRRTHEIGIRVALGAQPSNAIKLIMKEGLIITIIGLLIGIAVALGVTRVLGSELYGVSATDPSTFVVISLLLTAVAMLACYVPARKAASVDPLIALRQE